MTGPLDAAFAHHLWATDRLLDACEALTDDQLRTEVPGTYGTIIDTLRHMVGSDGWYLSFFRDEGVARLEEDGDGSIATMRRVMATNGPTWMSVVAAPDLDAGTDVVEHGEGWRFHAPAGLRLAQVIHHGTDHRSQICTALTSLGIEPPLIDLWDYGEATGLTRGEDLRTEA